MTSCFTLDGDEEEEEGNGEGGALLPGRRGEGMGMCTKKKAI